MKFGVLERLILLNVLPREGDFTTLKIIRQMREDLSFSEEEHKALKFKTEPDALTWDIKAEKLKEINFREKATDIIVDAFKKLNAGKRLTEPMLPLYERFVGDKP